MGGFRHWYLLGPLPRGQGKEKTAAAAGAAFNLDLATVELENPGGNGKAQSGLPLKIRKATNGKFCIEGQTISG